MRLKILYILSILYFALNVSAAELKYDIKVYGEKIASISVIGPGAESLIVTPSEEGKVITITGVSTNFTSLRKAPLPSLFKEIRSLSHGVSTDLILEFIYPTEITATPSTTSLQIMIKVKAEIKPGDANNAELKKIQTRKIEYRIPNLKEYSGATWLSTSFRISSALIDMFWALINGRSFSFDMNNNFKKDIISNEETKKTVALETLVSELNNEILELRKEIDVSKIGNN